jgi:hypothetical protein
MKGLGEVPAENSRSASVNVIAASQTPNHTTALLSNPHTHATSSTPPNHVPCHSHDEEEDEAAKPHYSCRGNPTHACSGMSTDSLRYDGNKSNIMTTTAAQNNSASTIIPDHDAAMPAKKEGGANVAPKRQKMDRNSAEYLIKSGLAGGFAGCAVRQDTF